jgi:NTP pyrophosphatase (non-canonical NTP hydrolase)
MNRLDEVDANYIGDGKHGPDMNVPLALTAAIGLGSESGEFSEIIKKIMFQGKPFNDENLAKLKSELGDIIWYWTNACRAFGFDPNEVIAENVAKLQARYPGGSFDPFYSENRKREDN